MFNLIVERGTANPTNGSLPNSRVFECTDDDIETVYKPDGQIHLTAVFSLPTLFMEEGLGNQIARVGWVSRLERAGRNIQFHYQFDQNIPPLTNEEIYNMSAELGIGDFEFSRNHWSIKRADLMYHILRREIANRPQPNVFQLSTTPVNPNLVSLMMPFSREFDQVHASVRAAIEALGHRCERADNFWQHAHIMQDIVELICTSSVVICDLSTKNANVFYEAGIAHSLGKEVILITQSIEDVPFDLRALRCVTYLNNGEGCQRLAADISARLQHVMGV